MIYSNLKDAINHYVVTGNFPTKITGYRLNTILNDMAETMSLLGLSNTLSVDNRTLGNDIIVSTGDKIIGQTDLLLSAAGGYNFYYAGPNYIFQQWYDGLGVGNTDFLLQGGGTQLFSHLFMDIQCDTGLYGFFSGLGTNKEGSFDFTGITDNRAYTYPDYDGEVQVGPVVKRYKALLSQNAPSGSITSVAAFGGGVAIIGQLWTVSTVGTCDFSNQELISGTMNVDGMVIRIVALFIPTSNVSSLMSYDGRPYVVSTDANGDLNPFVNTLGGNPVFSYRGVGDYEMTLNSSFLIDKTMPNLFKRTELPKKITRSSDDVLAIQTFDSGFLFTDDDLNYTGIEIEIYP